jgi:hypothetical protein
MRGAIEGRARRLRSMRPDPSTLLVISAIVVLVAPLVLGLFS